MGLIPTLLRVKNPQLCHYARSGTQLASRRYETKQSKFKKAWFFIIAPNFMVYNESTIQNQKV